MTSCPESAGQSVSLRYLTRPIFRFGTRPSTDRAVRPLPPVCGHGISLSYQPPNIGAVYSKSTIYPWSSGEIRKRSSQACCRQLEDRAPERDLLGGFPVSRLTPSQSSFSAPQGSHGMHAIWQVEVSSRTRTLRRRYGPSLRIFYALGTPHFPELS